MLLLMIRDNYVALSKSRKLDTSKLAPAGGGGGTSASADPWGVSDDALQQAFRPLHPAMAGQAAEASAQGKPQGKAAAAKQGGRSMSSLLWFFGVYFFFQWLLGRGS